MFIVLVKTAVIGLLVDEWVQFDEPVPTLTKAMKLTKQTSLPWLITIVVDRENGVSL